MLRDNEKVSRRAYSNGEHYIHYEGPRGPHQQDSYAQGYGIGQIAELGDTLPHPGNWPFSGMFYDGMRAALHAKGLERSLFGVVIKDASSE